MEKVIKDGSLPTAEEFIKDLQTEQGEQEYTLLYKIDIPKKMIDFAKLHVKAALKAASKVLDVDNDGDYIEHPTTERILNAYPLNNIK